MSTPTPDLPTPLTLDPNVRTLELFEHRVTTLAVEDRPKILPIFANPRTLALYDKVLTTSVHHRTTTLLLDG